MKILQDPPVPAYCFDLSDAREELILKQVAAIEENIGESFTSIRLDNTIALDASHHVSTAQLFRNGITRTLTYTTIKTRNSLSFRWAYDGIERSFLRGMPCSYFLMDGWELTINSDVPFFNGLLMCLARRTPSGTYIPKTQVFTQKDQSLNPFDIAYRLTRMGVPAWNIQLMSRETESNWTSTDTATAGVAWAGDMFYRGQWPAVPQPLASMRVAYDAEDHASRLVEFGLIPVQTDFLHREVMMKGVTAV